MTFDIASLLVSDIAFTNQVIGLILFVCLFFALESTPRSSLEPTGGNWPFEHAFSRPCVCRVPVRWPITDRHFMHDGNVRIDRKIYARRL